MDDDYLNQKLNRLWNKIEEGPAASSGGPLAFKDDSLLSAFESVQTEMQAESLQLLKSRFEKEKAYWENLAAAKEEMLSRLQKEVLSERERTQALKLKVQELQNGQTALVQQLFTALEMQKRTYQLRIENLEQDLEGARGEAADLQGGLRDEEESKAKLKAEWLEREKKWMEERDQREAALEDLKKEMFERRQKELEESAQLDRDLKALEAELEQARKIFETEKEGTQNLLKEKESEIANLAEELRQVRQKLDQEREERRLAAVERERQSVLSDESRKKMTEQILQRELKIKELQASLEKAVQERESEQGALLKRSEEIAVQEQALQKRREEWVESVRGQSGQQLEISEKVVSLLNRLEMKVSIRNPSVPPSSVSLPPPPLPSQPAAKLSSRPSWIDFSEKTPLFLRKTADFVRKEKGLALLVSGLFVFAATSVFIFMESEGRRSVRAQAYLSQGNEQYSMGELEASVQSLKEAWELDPENSIIRNSLTLVMGEVAHKLFREGRLEESIKLSEFLYKLLPEDPDVLQLHNEILQELGKRN